MRTKATAERELKGRRTVLPIRDLKVTEPAADGKRQIEGYAAVFGNRDSYGDVIVKGAFARTLRERPDVKVLWQHDPRQPIGKQLDAFEDDFGLRAQGELSNTGLVRDEAVPLLLDGVVTGLSIGYDVVEEEYDENLRTWFLKDIDLYEWSPVTFPANELASIVTVKELDGRKQMHAASVERHSKSLLHELEGYFEKSDRRDGLNLDTLTKLATRLDGIRQRGEHDQGADPGEVELAYLEGANDALDGKFNPTKE